LCQKDCPYPQILLKTPRKNGKCDVCGDTVTARAFDHSGNAPDEYQRLTPALEYALAHYRQRIPMA
jgi:hypothetical protein